MNKPVSVDFQFSVQQRGRGAKKRMIEGDGKTNESNKPSIRIPRVARYMALAIHFEGLIRQGIVTDYAELARLGHVTRARVSQIMNLLLLAPAIQEELLFTSEFSDRCQLKMLQKITLERDWKQQIIRWGRLNDLLVKHES